jgi:hypothetical protein
LALGVGLLVLNGCISIRRPEPFEQPIAGTALKTIAAVASPIAADAPATPIEARAVAAPAPARTEVKGAGDGSMKVDRVVITGKTIPHRAPNYSPEQTASFVCLASRQNGFNADRARKAHEATVYAKEMREKLKAGTATGKQADDAELKRQDAVRAYAMPVPLLGMLVDGSQKKSDLPEPTYQGVVIEYPDLFTFKENGKPVMAVSGTIRNTGTARVELPPLTLEALDEWEFVVAGQSSLLPFEAIEPGEARQFEMRFLNPPEYTAEIYVHFAPPFAYRNRRDCDFFDPSTFNADVKADALVQQGQTVAPPPAPDDATRPYSAAELNYLTQYYRRESATAWRCREAEKKRCLWTTHALRWRDMFAMSEAIDEAWIALRAADETRQRLAKGAATQAEVTAAEAARDKAQAAVREMGDKALARAGGSAPDVKVELTGSTVGRDERGTFVGFSGVARNTGTQPRTVDALMVAFVDRLELPLSSVAVDYPVTLQPGESATFTQRIPTRMNGGLNSIDIELGDGAAIVARAPPKEIGWSVRVGAMGK